jgi:hypothetical protein
MQRAGHAKDMEIRQRYCRSINFHFVWEANQTYLMSKKRKNIISRTKCIFKCRSAQPALCFITQSAARVRLQKTDIPRTLFYRAHSAIRNAVQDKVYFQMSACAARTSFFHSECAYKNRYSPHSIL